VLVHGAAEDGRSWQPQLAGLAGESTVVAWDEPGAGGSADLPAGFRLAEYPGLPGGAECGGPRRD
jgi:pimeloyl-ACP methyl ester carboxylesterase